MARKRKPDEPAADGAANGMAVADLPAATDPPAPGPATDPPAGDATPVARTRPAASFAAFSDRTTRIEVAVWARQVTAADGEEYTRYSVSCARGWKDTEGVWRDAAFYRVHDVPVLLYLVGRAYDWCLAQRAKVRIEPDADVPL